MNVRLVTSGSCAMVGLHVEAELRRARLFFLPFVAIVFQLGPMWQLGTIAECKIRYRRHWWTGEVQMPMDWVKPDGQWITIHHSHWPRFIPDKPNDPASK